MEDSKLMKNYPCLEDTWKLYNFDDDFEEGADNEQISSICRDSIAYGVHNIVNHKKVCEKLLRNLKMLYNSNDISYNFNKHCNNLNNWLYYEIKEHNISDVIIKKNFSKSNRIINKYGGLECFYFPFKNDLLESEQLVKLSIINNNINDINKILINELDPNICSCQNFIKQCVDLYKSIHVNHCSKGDMSDSDSNDTCIKLNMFRTHYEDYLTRKKIKFKLPELTSNTPTDIIDGCTSEETETYEEPPVQSNETDRPINQNASHALAAMVGIPPFLALMYKFTPVRNLFRFGNKKHTIITSDFEKKMENELFHVINEDSNIKDIQPKYNIGYEAA